MNPNELTPETVKLTAPLHQPRKRFIDPILQEVYDVKAKLNAEAGYSVERILERARQNSELQAAKR
jgi:hypothetical protein